MKLGRKYPTRAKLKLPNYLGPKLPPPPPSVDWTLAMTGNWGVMKNNVLGCCTVSAMGHAVQIVTSNGDGLITPPDNEIEKAYEVVGGYDPSAEQPDGSNPTDQGATELAAMKFMVTRGLAGVKVDAFADVDHRNIEAVKQCISLMGGCYIGVIITQADMDAFQAGKPWTDTSMNNVLGGHALWVPRYEDATFSCVTWAKLQGFDENWFLAKCDEAHACIFFPWVVNSVDTSPDGFNKGQLEADLRTL